MIYDIDDNPLYSVSLSLIGDGGDKTATVKIQCAAGMRLTGSAVDLVTVEARHEDADEWTDIETGHIDLGEWAGERETFELRFTAPDPLLGYAVRAFRLRVGP